MKRSSKLALGIIAATAVGYVVYRLIRSQKAHSELRNVADEGYETAHDVLYPRKETRARKQKYGPVLPGV